MKRTFIISGIVGVIILAIIIYNSAQKDGVALIEVPVQKGKFEVVVSTTGELQALNSEEIRGPENLRDVRVHNVKITDLVPEGTLVGQGDYVATLDRTDAVSRLQSLDDELEKDEATFQTTQLDTTMQLREYRNNLINLEFNVEELKIKLDQSKFEPPATIRQAEMNLDKAKRELEQARRNYQLKKQQAEANMTKVEINLRRQRARRDELSKVLDDFIIYAPKPGMVIYKKEWGGKKREVGSSISPWDPVVATLPDMSVMISKTYINEIDISKIAVGQDAVVGVDAFPDMEFHATVTDVANVGEQLATSDAKVFEVVLELAETDTVLRPAMTTVNRITTAIHDSVLFVPLECIHNTDSMSFVFKSHDRVRQIIEVGEANDNEIIILQGLQEGENVLMSKPEDAEDWDYEGWDIYEDVKAKRLIEEQKKKEEAAERLKLQERLRKQSKDAMNLENLPKEQRDKIMNMMKNRKSGGSGSGTTRVVTGGDATVHVINR